MVTILRTILPPVVAVGVLVAMAAFVLSHGDTMWRAVMLFDPWGIAAAIGLCVVYRVVNTGGWLLVLAALGQRVPALPATRIWLASEACRWIPGTVWSLGSRACLASARGVPLRVASASVALELVATVIGWTCVAVAGIPSLVSRNWFTHDALAACGNVACPVLVGVLSLALIAAVAVMSRWSKVTSWVTGHLVNLREADGIVATPRSVVSVLAFFIAMALLNGLVFLLVIRSLGTGSAVPLTAAITSNALAWLGGFFAIVAPGGLVVRETSMMALLAFWMPMHHGLAVAWTWRLVQIVAEIVTLAAVVLTGLPPTLKGLGAKGEVDTRRIRAIPTRLASAQGE